MHTGRKVSNFTEKFFSLSKDLVYNNILYEGGNNFMQLTLKLCVEEWKSLPWKKFRKIVFHLQHRIYKARQMGNYKLVSRLQRLLFKSRAARFLSIHPVTQLNKENITPGVDGITQRNEKERLLIFEEIKNLGNYKYQPLIRVYIPKSNGKKLPLGYPNYKRSHYTMSHKIYIRTRL